MSGKTGGLWRNRPGERTGKYLVQRRDGTVPEWPHIVLGGADPAAPAALRAYAVEAEARGYDKEYVNDICMLAVEFDVWRTEHGNGDPDAPPHRKDDPDVVARIPEGAA